MIKLHIIYEPFIIHGVFTFKQFKLQLIKCFYHKVKPTFIAFF